MNAMYNKAIHCGWFMLALVASMVLLGCARQNTGDVLADFAANHGWRWMPKKDHAMWVDGNLGALTDFARLDESERKKVKSIGISSKVSLHNEKIPDLDMFLGAEELIIVNQKEISFGYPRLPRLKKVVLLDTVPNEWGGLLEIPSLEELLVRTSNLEQLPDFSKLPKLKVLALDGSNIKSLRGIKTIKNNFVLNISRCYKLEDISDLIGSRVQTLYMISFFVDNNGDRLERQSEGIRSLYDRFKGWFAKYLPVLEQQTPGFTLEIETLLYEL